MYPVLPFGPMTIPTGPVVVLVATTVGLEIAGHYGRRLGLNMDNVWNVGLLALLAGLIVARLGNVIQFWPIYVAEPWLIISVRPSGFMLIPGIVASLLVGYGYILRHALEPVRVIAALLVGMVAGMAIIQAGMLLTGTLLGVTSDLPWLAYYDEWRHPVALYYALGLNVVLIPLWFAAYNMLPNRIILFLLFGCGLVYLGLGAFGYQSTTIVGWWVKQFGGLIFAFSCSLLLSGKE